MSAIRETRRPPAAGVPNLLASGARPRGRSTGRAAVPAALLPLVLLAACGREPAGSRPDPAAAGFDPERLAAAGDALLEAGSRMVLVRRGGLTALERYGGGHAPDEVHYGASIAKGIAGLGLALLAAEGRVRPDDPAARTVPEWRADPRRARITLRQLASHVAGLPNRGEAPWSERFWARRGDPYSVALREVPLAAEPDTGQRYSSPGFAVLELALAAALRGTGTPDLLLHLRQRVFRPCGIPDDALRFGYFGPAGLRRQGLRLHGMWGGLLVTGRALARLGELLVSPEEARACAGEAGSGLPAAIRPASDHPFRDGPGPGLLAGYAFWVNALGAWPDLPCDAAIAYGADDQILALVPGLDLVVVRLGAPLEGERSVGPIAAGSRVLGPVVAALSDPPAGCEPAGRAAGSGVVRPTSGLTPRRERP